MHICQAIGHHEHRRSISFLVARLAAVCRVDFILRSVLGSTAGSQITGIVPKLDLSKKSFRMGSFVCPCVALLIPIIFGNNGVSSRRQDKEIRDHGKISFLCKHNGNGDPNAKCRSPIEAGIWVQRVEYETDRSVEVFPYLCWVDEWCPNSGCVLCGGEASGQRRRTVGVSLPFSRRIRTNVYANDSSRFPTKIMNSYTFTHPPCHFLQGFHGPHRDVPCDRGCTRPIV